MKYHYLIFIILFSLFWGCFHDHGEDAEHEHHTKQVTLWTEKTELFMEYPELETGAAFDFIIHLTELNNFKPVAEKNLQLSLTSGERKFEHTVEKPLRPGIYKPALQFPHGGHWQMVITISGLHNDTIIVDDIHVADDHHKEEIEQEQHKHEFEISFLKEQQWNTDFRTEKVGKKSMCASISVSGEILSKIDTDVIVSSPFTGLVLPDHNPDLPQIGTTVSKGSPLVVLTPSAESGEENFAAKYIQRKSELELAQIELERSERLYAKKAISQKDMQKARADYQKAKAEFSTITTFVEEFDYSKQYGVEHSDMDFLLRAPISGTVEKIYFQPGRQLNSGDPLFRIIDAKKVWLQVNVPAALMSQIQTPDHLSFRLHGSEEVIHIDSKNGKLVSIGNIVEPDNRTVPLVFEVSNPQYKLKIGMFADVLIYYGEKQSVLSLSESALNEDEGHYSVYLQTGGESFVKREVTTGAKEFGYIEITGGLQEGDRVVTSGSYQVKLASVSSQLPEHGHAH